ncbi:hypothetical protein BDW74DRAFT_178215 [Aspergillus multicolor]|uniref:uncharacterized protein n=1 Tax=Aspergillus multicolor TaxID=41759 RepID=UPI003CCCE81A
MYMPKLEEMDLIGEVQFGLYGVLQHGILEYQVKHEFHYDRACATVSWVGSTRFPLSDEPKDAWKRTAGAHGCMFDKLSIESTIDTLLATAASKHADIHALVTAAISHKQRAESARVTNFDHYSRSVWREINVSYSRLSGSKQYDKCGPLANAKTRFNGLSVLRKIGKTICLSSNDTLGHEVQKNFQRGSELEDAMCGIIGAMSDEERRVIGTGGMRLDYCVFPEFSGVLERLMEGLYDDGGEEEEGWSEESSDIEAEEEDIAHIPGQFSWAEKPFW